MIYQETVFPIWADILIMIIVPIVEKATLF